MSEDEIELAVALGLRLRLDFDEYAKWRKINHMRRIEECFDYQFLEDGYAYVRPVRFGPERCYMHEPRPHYQCESLAPTKCVQLVFPSVHFQMQNTYVASVPLEFLFKDGDACDTGKEGR